MADRRPSNDDFVVLWSIALDVLVFGWTPLWASGLLGGLGPFLFVGLLERYLRRRTQQRRALRPAYDAPAPGVLRPFQTGGRG